MLALWRRARLRLALAALAALLGGCGAPDDGGGGFGPGAGPDLGGGPGGAQDCDTGNLRCAATRANFYWGAAGNAGVLGSDDPYRDALGRHFTIMTAENALKLPQLQPQPGVFDFSGGDRLADFARAQGLKMRGHVLIWREDLEPYLGPEPSREQAIAFMRTHIETVLGHYRANYRDVFVQWDVVNEAFRSDGSLRDSGWYRAIGPDFIAIAFRIAHEVWPELELYYNDFFELTFNAGGTFVDASGGIDPDAITPGSGITAGASACNDSHKCAGTAAPLCTDPAGCPGARAFLADLVAAGVPIDGVGFQAHIATPALAPDWAEFASWVENLNLRWALTELDRPCETGGSAQTRSTCFEWQRQAFGDAVAACAASPYCNTVVQWAVADPYSWWRGLSGGALGNAVALDDAFGYKPAAQAVLQALNAAGPPAAPTLASR